MRAISLERVVLGRHVCIRGGFRVDGSLASYPGKHEKRTYGEDGGYQQDTVYHNIRIDNPRGTFTANHRSRMRLRL